MDKNNLRESTNLKELSSIVKHIMSKKHGFTLWQNQDKDRVIIPGVISSHYMGRNELSLEFKITDSTIVDRKQKVYIFSPEANILIKGKIKIVARTKLKVVVDKKFYLKEKRKKYRIDLKNKNMNADIFRSIELKGTQKIESVQMKDLNDHGCGFYITSNRAVLFQPNSKVTLNSLESIPFKKSIKGIIKHITLVDASHSLNNKLMLVGVQFDEAYQDIDTIIQKVEVQNAI